MGIGRAKPLLQGAISDVSALGNFAYVGAWAPYCTRGANLSGGQGGIFVFDISDPSRPRQVNFLSAGKANYATEGIQAVHVQTPHFSGDLLVMSNEKCRGKGEGGITLWDITNAPAAKLLVRGAGDVTDGHFEDPDATISRDSSGRPVAHSSHSAMIWWVPGNNPPQTGRAYAALVDNEELLDVDIFDVTNPRRPVQMAETGLPDWPTVNVDGFGTDAFHHDMDVRKIGDEWRLMVSYWDAGWVELDVTDPSDPQLIRDFDYPDPDPLTGFSPPEGNAHQGMWNLGGDLFIGTDEDFAPYRLEFNVTEEGHPAEGSWDAGEFGWTVPIASLPDGTLNGPIIYGGYGCPGNPVPPATELGVLAPGEEAIVVFQRGPVGDPNNPGEACFFSEKVESGQDAGYDAVIIANHHAGSGAGAAPDAFICGSQGHAFNVTAHGLCIGHRFLHLAFDTTPDYTFPYPSPAPNEPAVGTPGPRIEVTSMFDGWGYVHLIDAGTFDEIDRYAIPEALDEDFAFGFGDLTVHEVETETREDLADLAYFSWYSGGLRVARFDGTGIEEVGHYIAGGGNNFWGVALAEDASGDRLILASDRDSGLWIFRFDTGP